MTDWQHHRGSASRAPRSYTWRTRCDVWISTESGPGAKDIPCGTRHALEPNGRPRKGVWMMNEHGHEVRLELDSGYRFRVSFGDGRKDLITDLAPPLGHGEGPEPSELLAAAVGNCLASSFLYCARRARIEPRGLWV